jgi:flagellar biosynthesis protein
MSQLPPTPPPGRRKLAVAIKYEPNEDRAPMVVAAGKGLIADTILAEAQKAGVPVKEDAGLAQALGTIEVGREIPPEMYRAVAEVLAFIFRVHGRMKAEHPN